LILVDDARNRKRISKSGLNALVVIVVVVPVDVSVVVPVEVPVELIVEV